MKHAYFRLRIVLYIFFLYIYTTEEQWFNGRLKIHKIINPPVTSKSEIMRMSRSSFNVTLALCFQKNKQLLPHI